MNEGTFEQYVIQKIRNVVTTLEKFSTVHKDKIDSLFYTSLKSWIGSESFSNRIRFNKNWKGIIKNKVSLINQKIIDLMVLHYTEKALKFPEEALS